MKDCAKSREKFIAALSAWMLVPVLSDGTPPPQLSDYGLCRSCTLEAYSRLSELVSVYAHDVEAIIVITQDQLEEMAQQSSVEKSAPSPFPKPLKH